MNLKKMMQQAAKMQEQLAQTQSELADKTVTATAGGGKVTVTANGAGEVLSIKIDKTVVDPEDVEGHGPKYLIDRNYIRHPNGSRGVKWFLYKGLAKGAISS